MLYLKRPRAKSGELRRCRWALQIQRQVGFEEIAIDLREARFWTSPGGRLMAQKPGEVRPGFDFDCESSNVIVDDRFCDRSNTERILSAADSCWRKPSIEHHPS